MRKIIYYGISSDAPFFPSPFLPKFLELLHDEVDTFATHGTFFADRTFQPLSGKFLRTCLTARQVSRVPVDKRHVSSGIHANHTTGHARLLLEFLEFKKGVPEFNLFLDGLLRSYEKTH